MQKKQFYKNKKVVLCEKPLEKTLNIREMRRFWMHGQGQKKEQKHETKKLLAAYIDYAWRRRC